MSAGPDNHEKNPRPHTMTRVAALINQKGGVGKTTTAVNLAAGVAELGRRVLLIDLDPQAHSTLHLGVDPASVDRSVYDVLLEDPRETDPATAIVRTRERLGLLAAETDLAAIESELAGVPDRSTRLSRAIEPLKSEYEFIFVDCPPSLGLLTLNALAMVREVVVPMQAHYLALQGMGKLLETVTLIGRGVNPRLRVTGVVLCQHEETTKLSKEVVADMEAFFKGSREKDVPWKGARVMRPAIRRNVKLAECPSFGKTIFEYAPQCPGALDYLALARGFVEEWDRLLAKRADPGPADAAPEVVVKPGAAAESRR
ncbi:MAG TPA: ParA family protein [Phycisphaerales bacterium]|nr:ParA family protein [Phycisphaerales bacterium]